MSQPADPTGTVPHPADATVPTPYRVSRRDVETTDVVSITIEPVGDSLAEALPGQFHMLYAHGVGEAPISVASRAGPHGTVVHAIRAVGAVTRALAGAAAGSVIGVRGPFGTSWGAEGARGSDLVLVAGGIGLAPLRPLVEMVLARRAEFGRLLLLVGARTPDDLVYRELLEQWQAEPDFEVAVAVDAARPGWTGHVGVVTDLLERAELDPARTFAAVCGPEVMMRRSATALLEHGVAAVAIRVSIERNMHCGSALCGHCQLGPFLLCRDGPVLPFDAVARELMVRER